RQNTNLQYELTLIRKILNMQLEIDSLREEVNRLRDENTRLKNAISYQENGKQNKIVSSREMPYSNAK
ncbi:800_t:CDS:1, partial [Funneliformis mosseae]